MSIPAARLVTPVTLAFAPDWLTIDEACYLLGHDQETVKWLILDGGVEAKQDGDTWLVDKWSLHEYQETH